MGGLGRGSWQDRTDDVQLSAAQEEALWGALARFMVARAKSILASLHVA